MCDASFSDAWVNLPGSPPDGGHLVVANQPEHSQGGAGPAIGGVPGLRLEYCGEWVDLPCDRPYAIGRDADFVIDENPFLHRRFLEVRHDGLWWLANRGVQLAATLSDPDGRVQSWLAPGAQLPLVLGVTLVRFTAGPTSYELGLHLDEPMTVVPVASIEGVTDSSVTIGPLALNPEQRLLVLALAERSLRRPGSGFAEVPTSAAAAARLGWPLTTFNRKLDKVCQKLERAGVRGLHGAANQLATRRKGRLVEYALATRLVTVDDLELLPDPEQGASP